ncbi:uncharacterized protein DUF2867 [Luteibacter rhizovicinus]|uniref:Uncharacterized protein DUF2867 n=1 Tax=Luteibacter rhizovicinus TaxID=242606 RepID=A0A4R3YXS8_9GAMM|nr:DUF2867 domain-containing protein [Luteibacter rhizovicinus]TCV97376.1 uncharacterized protein DUF2867 [Luteibacter rhizovicinus]
MSHRSRATASFPSARIPSSSGGLPVEVSLIAQLGHGAGSQLIAAALLRQKAHVDFVDELDEPSAKLAGTHFEQGDATSLYTFAVGAKGHPFHRHAGHRIFTAVSGSAGAQLRFSMATPDELAADPANFLRALRYIDIPPDSLFTVRFGGGTWHQFSPLRAHSGHPAFFALSCHTNELGGDLPESLRRQVMANEATIPSLTELLPENVLALIEGTPADRLHVPTVALTLEAAPGSMQGTMCDFARRFFGVARSALARLRRAGGFMRESEGHQTVIEMNIPAADSMLHEQFADRFHHQDSFLLTLEDNQSQGPKASVLLASLLDGFLHNPPVGVSRMMTLRNILVRPLGLRTSPLGCPVSSLLAKPDRHVFAGRFPVLDQRVDKDDTYAQVILGADDKHLMFRSCVGLRVVDGRVDVTLGTRVRCKNLFGHVYIRLIDRVHRRYVSPAMLRKAAEHAFASQPAADMVLPGAVHA